MASKNHIKKSNMLGMSFSTADYRLKKLILFSLLKRCNENYCFHCGLSIDRADELSIEHKTPWLDVDASLFWDLDNIAFSHGRCNSSMKRTDTPANQAEHAARRKKGDEGTAWCRGHQRYLLIEKFSKNSSRWNGLQGECNECRLRNPSRKIKKSE